jgi:hypothetical protein
MQNWFGIPEINVRLRHQSNPETQNGCRTGLEFVIFAFPASVFSSLVDYVQPSFGANCRDSNDRHGSTGVTDGKPDVSLTLVKFEATFFVLAEH